MPERAVLLRAFGQAGLRPIPGEDGRTLNGLVVPYGEIAEVYDPHADDTYRETFDMGAFARPTKAPNRVRLKLAHEDGTAALVGYGREFREAADGPAGPGLYGTIRLLEADAPKVRELIAEGGQDGLSVEFIPLRSRMDATGVLHRVEAHLDHVGLVDAAAYPSARVLQLRAAGRHELEPEVIETPARDEVMAWLAGRTRA